MSILACLSCHQVAAGSDNSGATGCSATTSQERVSTAGQHLIQEDDAHDWEDAAAASPAAPSGELEIQLQCDGDAALTASRKQRAAVTKVDREYAALLHQSHLLFLLGRGLLFDAAADDAFLQACFPADASVHRSRAALRAPADRSGG